MEIENMELGEEPAEHEDKEEISSQELFELAVSSYNSSSDYFSANIRKTYADNLRQFNSQHFSESKYLTDSYKTRSRLFKPITRSAIRKHEAALASTLFSTEDVCNIDTLNPADELQSYAANFYRELMNLRLKRGNWFKIAQGAYQDSMVYGSVISKQYWDFETNCPKIQVIAPENFFFDPSADWVDPITSSPYLVEVIPMKLDDVLQKIKYAGWIDIDERDLLNARKNKFDSVRMARENTRLDPQDRPNSVDKFDIVYVHLNIIRYDGIDYAFYTAGTEALLTHPVPIEEVFLHGKRPYTMGQAVIETHKNYPSGLTQLTRTLQQEANDISNLRLDNVNLSLNPRVFIKRNQNVDGQAIRRNIPGAVIPLNDPKGDVNWFQAPDVTNTSYQESNLINLAIDDIVGGFNGSTVQSNRSLNETVGGMNLLSATANQVTEYQIMTFLESWVKPTLNQFLDLLQHYENDEVILEIAGQKADIINHFRNVHEMNSIVSTQRLNMSVSVGMGSTNPVNHVEKMMLVMSSMAKIYPDLPNRLNFAEVAKEMFAKIGFKDYERFINGAGQEDPEKEMLKQQIADLQNQLQMKKPDFMWQAEAELTKATAMEKRIAAAYGAMQAAEVLSLQPATAPIADGIMRGAGWENENGQSPNLITPESGVSPDATRQVVNNPDIIKENNNPLTPSSPDVGFNSGIEGGE